jgi:hypothetical protein
MCKNGSEFINRKVKHPGIQKRKYKLFIKMGYCKNKFCQIK